MHVILRALLLRPGPGGRIRVAEDHAVKARHGACINGKNMVADISAFGVILSPAEMGYLVSLQNGVKGEKNAKTVLTDCIKVILRENGLKMSQKYEDLSVDEWTDHVKKLIDYKKGD